MQFYNTAFIIQLSRKYKKFTQTHIPFLHPWFHLILESSIALVNFTHNEWNNIDTFLSPRADILHENLHFMLCSFIDFTKNIMLCIYHYKHHIE